MGPAAMGRRRRALTAGVAVALAGTAATAGFGSSATAADRAAAGAVPRVKVTLAEFTLRAVPAKARRGRVTFVVRNAGDISHEFVVIRTKRRAAKLPVSGGRASEAGSVGEIGNVRSGATKRVTLRLAAGHYALICNLPGHYRAGQHADFTVR